MGLGRLGSRGEMVPRSENSLSHHWQLGDQRQGLGGQKGAREGSEVLGLGSPWLICRRPARAISSGPLSQAVEQRELGVGRSQGDMIGRGSSSFREPIT